MPDLCSSTAAVTAAFSEASSSYGRCDAVRSDRRRGGRRAEALDRSARILRRDVPAGVVARGLAADGAGQPRRSFRQHARRSALPPLPGRLLVRPVRAGARGLARSARVVTDAGHVVDGRARSGCPPRVCTSRLGVAHGFYAITDATITYLVDNYYNPADELGVAWDDPALHVDWPCDAPILSDRDRANPRIADIPADIVPPSRLTSGATRPVAAPPADPRRRSSTPSRTGSHGRLTTATTIDASATEPASRTSAAKARPPKISMLWVCAIGAGSNVVAGVGAAR